jgi:gliding motility-associated-like protein
LICYGTSANINAKASGGNGNFVYSWNQGLAKIAGHTVSPLTTTLYIIVLSDGCSAASPIGSIRVSVRAKLTVKLPADSILCNGQSLNLGALITGGDTANRKILWGSGQSVPNITIQPNAPTIYTIRVFDNCSNPEARDTISVSVRSPLSVNLPADDTICVGQSKWLTTVSSGGNAAGYLFRWENGLGLGDKLLVNPANTTTYIVILSDGCTLPEDTATVTVYVRKALTLKTSGDTTACEGDTINIQAIGSGGVSSGYQFDWGSSIGFGAIQSIIPFNTKWYKVTFNDGCSDYAFDSLLVTVKPSPQPNFSLDINPVCTYKDVLFRNLTPFGSTDIFLWDFGDGSTSAVIEPTRQYADSGLYTVKLTVTNSFNCTRTKTEPAFVEVVAMPRPSFEAGSYLLPISEAKAFLTNTSSYSTNYLWDFGDGNTSTDFSTEHSYSDTGTYPVSLVAYNRIGCDSTFMRIIRVKPLYNLFIPTAFSPNDDGDNDHFVPIGTAIKTYDLILFNRWGEIIFSSKNRQMTWDGKDYHGTMLMQGNYFYRLSVIDMESLQHFYSGAVLLMR